MMGAYRFKSYGFDGIKLFIDPRTDALGLRVIVPEEHVPRERGFSYPAGLSSLAFWPTNIQ